MLVILPNYCSPEQPKIQTKVQGHSLVRSLAPLIYLFALHYPLRCAHSLARGTVNDWMAIHSVFFSVLDHSANATYQ